MPSLRVGEGGGSRHPVQPAFLYLPPANKLSTLSTSLFAISLLPAALMFFCALVSVLPPSSLYCRLPFSIFRPPVCFYHRPVYLPAANKLSTPSTSLFAISLLPVALIFVCAFLSVFSTLPFVCICLPRVCNRHSPVCLRPPVCIAIFQTVLPPYCQYFPPSCLYLPPSCLYRRRPVCIAPSSLYWPPSCL
jgi:hypothetical protein